MRVVEAGRHVEDTGQRPFVGEFVKVENLGPIALQINNIKLSTTRLVYQSLLPWSYSRAAVTDVALLFFCLRTAVG